MYDQELEIGKQAVLKAMRFTHQVQNKLTSGDSLNKEDKSPVTIADFAAQAIICRILHNKNYKIPIVGEEDSNSLQIGANRPIVDSILNFLRMDKNLSELVDKSNLFSSIDIGNQEPNDFFWTLDPIDGTKGFLRGDQFAIALALIKNGEVVLGILGCPSISFENDDAPDGYLFYGVKGKGANILNVSTNVDHAISVSKNLNFEDMKFVQSYEPAHGDFQLMETIAKDLNIKKSPFKVDSQVKYGIVACGRAEIYLRIPNPRNPDYKEKIWDHAAGSLIVMEAGGTISDIKGKRLDFGCGKTLRNNTGILVCLPEIKDQILNHLK